MASVVPSSRPIILPSKGIARVKNVLSGDTVILLGTATTPNGKAPEITFTLENVSAPRMASKGNSNIDEPGAFPAREWLRQLVVGKSVTFETRKQGASAGDRVYGLLTFTPPGINPGADTVINVAVEAVRNGHATPKAALGGLGATAAAPAAMAATDGGGNESEVDGYKDNLLKAYDEAKKAQVGIHSATPLVRKLKNSGEDFEAVQLVQSAQALVAQGGRFKCVIEYVFDGSRFRLQITDPIMGDFLYGGFTLLLAGVSCPRVGNPRADPPTPSEDFAEEARTFAEQRILQRELEVVLLGTDKSGTCGIGTLFHPRGDITVELLKNGLGKISDWSVRMMAPADVPNLRTAETAAKRTNTGVWHSYMAPALSSAAEISGIVVEVLTGDTIAILPDGQEYDSEDKLIKISLASIRAPRVGNERVGRADEPYCHECKDRLRVLTVGKPCKVQIHYERNIAFGETSEKRQFGTVSTKNKPDVSEVLIAEGLAISQFHKDGEETSPRYDDLRAAEAVAKAAKKGIHSEKEYKAPVINDLSDPKKAKAYSGSLMRAGKLKAVVEYCFNGARFKVFVPSENCQIIFAPNYLRCPQPSPPGGSSRVGKVAEPFGDDSKRHARLTVHQRAVEIECSGVTMGGVITGSMFVGNGAQRRDYSLELVEIGLGAVDQRKIDYGEAPKQLVDAQITAQESKVGIWSLERAVSTPSQRSADKYDDQVATIRVSEIRSGTHFFYHVNNDDAVRFVDDSMKLFTTTNGTTGAPCDVKINRLVAALFDDGTGKSWYRAKIVERAGAGNVVVLFVDHGNLATVPVATHLRPLDETLGIDRIPGVAKEATLALTVSRPLSDEHGVDAARLFQSLCWGKDLSIRIHGIDDNGKIAVVIMTDTDESVNEKLVSAGLALVAKPAAVQSITMRMVDPSAAMKLASDLSVAQEMARKSHEGMWRYGDVGDDDDDDRN